MTRRSSGNVVPLVDAELATSSSEGDRETDAGPPLPIDHSLKRDCGQETEEVEGGVRTFKLNPVQY
jgi:hypothetical protein